MGTEIRINDIGVPGEIGFGVGICPEELLPKGIILMEGCVESPEHDNYGNYRFREGSVEAYIPKCYTKVGTGKNGLPVNFHDIKSIYDFGSTKEANEAGYALPRAFIDGGLEQAGVFVDKYMVSKNAWGAGFIASSLKNGKPLSTYSRHNPIGELTAAKGINAYYKMIDCAHARDGVDGEINIDSIWFERSQFIGGLLAFLAIAHGQASKGRGACAWYDPKGKYNFPKGCNDGALGDVHDPEVKYQGDGWYGCGLTGSGEPFARTSHNGQASGVADLVGLMWEISTGITSLDGKFYVARERTAMRKFTGGNSGVTDHWGVAGISEMMEEISIHDFGRHGLKFWGNGKNQVLSEAVSGNGWLLTSLGIPQAKGLGDRGTDLFGKNGFWWWPGGFNELCLLASAFWDHGSGAGVWYLYWAGDRSDSGSDVGGRFACYPVEPADRRDSGV